MKNKSKFFDTFIKSEESTVSVDVGFESPNLSTSISFIPDADYDVQVRLPDR